MKQDKILTIILALANILLLAFCVAFLIRTDREEPEFEFQETEIVYRSGMDVAKLVDGITAYDKADGDVSGRIVLEKIVEDETEKTVVVYYAVSDKAGNVAKCSRVFPAILLADDAEPMSDAGQEAEQFMEAGVAAELGEKETTSEEPTETEVLPEASAIEESEESMPTPEPTPTVEPTPEEEQEPVVQQPAQPAVNPAAPVLTLNTGQIVTQRGVNPPWVNSISVLKDDKDGYETLFNNLKISKFNVNEPGSYPVTIYTEDSDGNQSIPVSVTIIVN